jgi:catechol 2,3-dioxygenase-like lactoylglutathione lyase family enzyme
MLSHLSFGVSDLGRATAFYEQALAPLGYVRVLTKERAVGFGEPGREDRLTLFSQPLRANAPGPGFHLAFIAPTQRAVDEFHAAALAAGATDCGAPGLRPHYGFNYYAAFVADPDGYKLEALHQ